MLSWFFFVGAGGHFLPVNVTLEGEFPFKYKIINSILVGLGTKKIILFNWQSKFFKEIEFMLSEERGNTG
jgi:hypothetical protein